MKKVYFTLICLFVLIFILPSSIYAQNSEVVVKGYDYNRTRFALVDTGGSVPANPYFHADRLYSALGSGFGPGKKVPCTIQLQGTQNYVHQGDLVDVQGGLTADIFWAPPISSNLSDEEANELAKFVNEV